MTDIYSYTGEEQLQEEMMNGVPSSGQMRILTPDPDFNFDS